MSVSPHFQARVNNLPDAVSGRISDIELYDGLRWITMVRVFHKPRAKRFLIWKRIAKGQYALAEAKP